MTILKKSVFFLISALVFSNCLGMEQPLNFGWLIEGQIAGMARPKKAEHLRWVEKNNFGLVVTLTGEGRLPDTLFESTNLKRLYIPIQDYRIPTFEQVDLFIKETTKIIETGKAVIVHCAGGKGRTGTMLACWLVVKENMDPISAIAFVRKQRPGSVETQEQEAFVCKYSEYFKTK